MDSSNILKKYWGYDCFRPLQQEIIEAVLNNNDVLALMPTGGGKSICFQVPALAQDGICLVVSPLIALIKDQLENLKKKGIPALAIYSGMSFLEIKKTLQNAAYGNYKFLYVSPERLQTNLFKEYLPALHINLIAVDEAHCISQWGYDFRPSYLQIADLRQQLPKTPVLALTASATPAVQQDIGSRLLFKPGAAVFQQSFERPNLSYSVFSVAAKQNKLLEILTNVKGSSIVYCRSRKHTKEVAELLLAHNIAANYYHAGLSSDERNIRQQSWVLNKTRVMCCTNAFGMGIDKPDVRVVVHYDVPDCLENYYQEAGRAGRDGKKAYAVLLYTSREIQQLEEQANNRYPEAGTVKQVYVALMNYLQVAAGAGENCSYDFDLAGFTQSFKLNLVEAMYAIKTLEQEEIVTYNESFFKPSVVAFTCGRQSLEAFEKDHPSFSAIIKGMLRSYEGIFDFPVTISESRLAQLTGLNASTVLAQLQQLTRLGIIEYQPQKDKPQITLLLNRMYADSFRINLTNHLQRKAHYISRLSAIKAYINDTSNCRGKIIGNYFGDDDISNCGICDTCIQQKNTHITASDVEEISTAIITIITKEPIGTPALLPRLKKWPQQKIWEVINYLQAEEKITISSTGIFSIKH
ncbi:MAG: hypothetical protein RL172_1307 [Bacteroidota bacterium]